MDRRIIAQLFDSIDYISSLSKHSAKDDEEKESDPQKTENTEEGMNPEVKKRKELATNKFVVLVVATNK